MVSVLLLSKAMKLAELSRSNAGRVYHRCFERNGREPEFGCFGSCGQCRM